MSAVLTVQNLSKSFGARRVFDDVSLAVDEQDRVALVGVNGSGKSTLLRMIAHALGADDTTDLDVPDSGLITKQLGASFTFVSQEPKLPLGSLVLEYLKTAFGDEDKTYEVEALASALHIPLEQTIATLSLGERRRVALGYSLLRAPDVLALDEPTNHLDARSIDWLEGRLKAHRGALLLVTHDRYFLDRVATRIVEVDRGYLYAYGSGYATFLEKQAERLANANERERVRRSFVRREIDWIRRGPAARTTKQQARIDRFDSAVKAGDTNKDLVSDDRSLVLTLPPGPRLGKTILELDHVRVDNGGETLVQDLTLVMKPGDRIGIVGPNGAGKTTLVRTILGEREPASGRVTVGQNTRFAYLDQGRADLDDERTVLEEVSEGTDKVDLATGAVHVRTFLRMFLFDDRFADTPIGKLSGGERNRVQLTKLLRRGGNVLVLDEPTNDLDLITLGVLEEALQAFPGCVLVVSHDRWFLDRVATGILAFEGDGRVQFYEGSYSDWLGRTDRAKTEKPKSEKPKTEKPTTEKPATEKPTTEKPTTEKPTTDSAAKPKKLSYKEQREWEGMETAIAAAEARVTELEATLSSPDLYATRSSTEVTMMASELDTARQAVDALYGRWSDLESRIKGA
jgi:ATP-binding cassette subfamily F protein uup